MKPIGLVRTAVVGAMVAAIAACGSGKPMAESAGEFVRVEHGRFYVGDSVYRFVGTNFWYGAILASTGRGGDRERLARELDLMQQTGIDNVRILVGGDGDESVPSHIQPVLQTAPGVYNDTILDGLDYLMAELERRGMKAVLYLNNSWEWSGGYGTYLQWAGCGVAPDPTADGYRQYVDHVAQFVRNDSARQMAANHVRHIVSRTNRYTHQPYTESTALMAWEIANEPRAFASDSLTKRAFASWIREQAQLIKRIDANHLVATGSEGLYGCQVDMDLWEEIHTYPEIDYGILHLWPSNWGWVNRENLTTAVDTAWQTSLAYIMPHVELMHRADRPLVLEEFGYPRDGFAYGLTSPTEARNRFYDLLLTWATTTDCVQGVNFWAWGGYAQPRHERWQPGDDYAGDPAQEPQGLFSVFAGDSITLRLIRQAATAATRSKK